MYVPPTQRRGVHGPSGGKSEYHCATLVGNWQEEREGFGQHSQSQPQGLEYATTHNTSYRGFSPAAIAGAKPPGCFCGEGPRELLFYHGDVARPVKNRLTLAELSYTDRSKEIYTNDEILDMEGVSKRGDKTVKLQKSLGMSVGGNNGDDTTSNATLKETMLLRSMTSKSEADHDVAAASRNSGYVPPRIPPVGRVEERNRFLSTKQVTIDASGKYISDHSEVYPLTSSVCIGQLMASKNDPMHRTQLRYE